MTEKVMKCYKMTIHQYQGEDGYQKPHEVARFYIEAIDDDMAYELADAARNILPFDGFVLPEELVSGVSEKPRLFL